MASDACDALVSPAAEVGDKGKVSAAGAASQSAASASSSVAARAAPKPHKQEMIRHRGARDVSTAYEILGPVGEGAYGVVWKARDRATGETVALKMIKTGESGGPDAQYGFPMTSVREIRILKSLRHVNIVNLKEVATDMEGSMVGGRPGGVYMVFEYLEADLEGLLRTPDVRLTPLHIKSYIKQLLDGLSYMHKQKVAHRDLKGANLLISSSGYLKIGDFGLARSQHDNLKQQTAKVITLWYRPPELLLRCEQYGQEVDMWSVGCIFGELLTGRAILTGKDELDQLDVIFKLCGHPAPGSWYFDPKNEANLPDWPPVKQKALEDPYPPNLANKFKQYNLDVNTLDLLQGLLTLDPDKRVTAEAALGHQYFHDRPACVNPEQVPRLNFSSCHEYDAKERSKQERAERAKQDAERKLAMQKAAAAREQASRKPVKRVAASTESTGW